LLLIVDISSLWLPESPKFLLKAGRREEAILILKRIAKFNNKSIDAVDILSEKSTRIQTYIDSDP
jgi:hypothetical protein